MAGTTPTAALLTLAVRVKRQLLGDIDPPATAKQSFHVSGTADEKRPRKDSQLSRARCMTTPDVERLL